MICITISPMSYGQTMVAKLIEQSPVDFELLEYQVVLMREKIYDCIAKMVKGHEEIEIWENNTCYLSLEAYEEDMNWKNYEEIS